MRILLVAPRFIRRPGDYYEFPLGLCYVSASLKQAGFEVDCLNLNHEEISPAAAVERRVRRGEYDAVCSGGLSVHYHAVKDILEAARKARPDILTVAGGGLVSSEPEIMIEALGLSAGVVGEGEATAPELLRALESGADLNAVPGVVLRGADGKPALTAARPAISDLDALPFPDYESFGVDRYLDQQRPGDTYYMYARDTPRILPVIASRSCPFNCTFCYHPLGNRYRRRSLGSFLAEVRHAKERFGVNMLAVLDELFPTDPEWLDPFCAEMAGLDLAWIAQLRVNGMDRGALRKLKSSGLFCISYGLESASEPVLKSMKKRITVPEIESALAATWEEEVGIQGNFLFGDPAETPARAAETLDWWERHPRYRINLNFVIPYPGSEIHARCVEQGLIPDRLAFIEAGCPALDMTGQPAREREAVAARIARVKAGRRFFAPWAEAAEEGFDPAKGGPVHALAATCPHCGRESRYSGILVEGLHVFSLACRQCNQRFDLLPTVIPGLRRRAEDLAGRLRALARAGTPLAVAPALFEDTFLEYMRTLGVDPLELPIAAFLDDRPERIGRMHLGAFPVLPLEGKTLAGLAGHVFLVVPSHGWQAAARRLEDLGVPPERLCTDLDDDADQSSRPTA